MIIVDPEIGKKIVVNSPTEFVDVYPTLCDLAGIKVPGDLAGVSLKPLINASKTKINEYAYSEMTRGNPAGEIIGYSLRNERYRYTVWVKNSPLLAKQLDKNNMIGEELYDYITDPLETKSFINNKSHKKVLTKMQKDFVYYFDHIRALKGGK